MKQEKNYKYYNDKEYKRILKLKESGVDTFQIFSEYEKYVEKYPYDSNAIVPYASSLINMGYFDKAEEVLNDFILTRNVRKENIGYYYKTYIKLLGCYEKYEECYQILKEHEDLLKNYSNDFYFILIYLLTRLNLPIEISFGEKDYSYTMKQAIFYDETLALKHIDRHINSHEENKSIFNDNFSACDWFNKLRSMLPNDNYPTMYAGIFRNFYIFKYDNCGTMFDGRKTDYFEVITLQHSNQILTMYPIINSYNTPFIDINPEKIVDTTSNRLVKRMSQIDKFNQRYGKMIDKK